MEICQGFINGLPVLLYHGLPTLAIGLLNATLDLLNGLFLRQNTAQREEARLHDCVDTPDHAYTTRHFMRVDDITLQGLRKDLLLHLVRNIRPDVVRTIVAVK